MTQAQYESILASYDSLLKTGMIDEVEHTTRVNDLNKDYVNRLRNANIEREKKLLNNITTNFFNAQMAATEHDCHATAEDGCRTCERLGHVYN